MNQASHNKSMIYALVLGIGMSMLVPEVAFSASRSFRRSGKSSAPAVRIQHGFTGRFRSGSGVVLGQVQARHRFKDPFDRSRFHSRFSGEPGFIGGHVLDLGDVVIIQIPPPAPTISREPAHTGTYVDPQWVDGGHGVEILRPGYWGGDQKQR